MLVALALASLQFTGSTIQSYVNAALAAGQTTCSIPKENYVLTSQVNLPVGTTNFTIEGNGSTVTAPGQTLSTFFSVGGNASNLWSMSGKIPLTQAVAYGSNTAYVAPSTVIKVNDHYDLFDYHQVVVSTGSGAAEYDHIDPELVVTAYNSATGQITFDTTVSRNYTTPYILDVQKLTTSKLTLQDFVMNGSVINGTPSSFGISAGFCDSLTLNNITLQQFQDSFVLVSGCRYETCNNIHCDNGNSTSYGINSAHSRWITIFDCEATNQQHGNEVANSCDGVVTAFVETSAPLDEHGMDDERWTYNYCGTQQQSSDFSVGNAAWNDPDSGVILNSCWFNSFHPCAGTTGLVANSCQFAQMWFDSSTHAGTNIPISAVFNGGGSTCPTYNIPSDMAADQLTFNNFSFITTQTGWSDNFSWSNGAFKGGSVTCNNCLFQNYASGYSPISLSSAGTLNLNSCMVNGNKSKYAVILQSGFTGRFNYSNCNSNAPTFLEDLVSSTN
jgi:hypothetical protein